MDFSRAPELCPGNSEYAASKQATGAKLLNVGSLKDAQRRMKEFCRGNSKHAASKQAAGAMLQDVGSLKDAQRRKKEDPDGSVFTLLQQHGIGKRIVNSDRDPDSGGNYCDAQAQGPPRVQGPPRDQDPLCDQGPHRDLQPCLIQTCEMECQLGFVGSKTGLPIKPTFLSVGARSALRHSLARAVGLPPKAVELAGVKAPTEADQALLIRFHIQGVSVQVQGDEICLATTSEGKEADSRLESAAQPDDFFQWVLKQTDVADCGNELGRLDSGSTWKRLSAFSTPVNHKSGGSLSNTDPSGPVASVSETSHPVNHRSDASLTNTAPSEIGRSASASVLDASHRLGGSVPNTDLGIAETADAFSALAFPLPDATTTTSTTSTGATDPFHDPSSPSQTYLPFLPPAGLISDHTTQQHPSSWPPSRTPFLSHNPSKPSPQPNTLYSGVHLLDARDRGAPNESNAFTV
eukprot:gene28179-31275_t